MHLSNWAVTYGADGNVINETIAERMLVCMRRRGRERSRNSEKDKGRDGVRKVRRDQRDSLA